MFNDSFKKCWNTIKVTLVHDFSWPCPPSMTSLRTFIRILASWPITRPTGEFLQPVWKTLTNVALTINLVNDSNVCIMVERTKNVFSLPIDGYHHQNIIFGAWRRALSLSYRNHAEYVRQFLYLCYLVSVTYRLIITLVCVIFRRNLLVGVQLESYRQFFECKCLKVKSYYDVK